MRKTTSQSSGESKNKKSTLWSVRNLSDGSGLGNLVLVVQSKRNDTIDMLFQQAIQFSVIILVVEWFIAYKSFGGGLLHNLNLKQIPQGPNIPRRLNLSQR